MDTSRAASDITDFEGYYRPIDYDKPELLSIDYSHRLLPLSTYHPFLAELHDKGCSDSARLFSEQ